jgi:general stress protein YciG
MANKKTRQDVEERSNAEEENETRAPAMTVAEAGRKGGRTTARRRGPEFYREIGRKGGVATAETHGVAFYSEIGRKGGEARAEDPDVRSGALGRKGARARWGNSHATTDKTAPTQPNENGKANKGRTRAKDARTSGLAAD